jgi:integrase/recombinase XerD
MDHGSEPLKKKSGSIGGSGNSMSGPVITIFVRHSPGCKYAGDEFTKRCHCRKHLRWTQNGKQYRRKAGTRSWEEAEEAKRRLEDQLAGRPHKTTAGLLLDEAIRTFEENKKAQGIKSRVRAMYSRELKRVQQFSEGRGLLTVTQALTIENLIALRATWSPVYKSSYSRAVVQKHLNHFLRFAYNAGWIERIPRLSPIKITAPETEPLTEKEYARLLKAATGKTAALIELMRWSGLAIRDASTLKREDLIEEGGLYKIIRDRTKTGTPLYIPIPERVALAVQAVMNGNTVYVFWDRKTATSSEYRHAGYMGELVAKAFTAAGIESEGHMISHRLRATFAVDLLQKGVPLEHVSRLLGHKSVITTERHYAKWVKGRQKLLDSLVSGTWDRK